MLLCVCLFNECSRAFDLGDMRWDLWFLFIFSIVVGRSSERAITDICSSEVALILISR